MRKSNLQLNEQERALEPTPVNPYYPPLPPNYNAEPEVESDWHLRDYLHSVRKHWRLIALVTVLIAALTIVYVARQPDVYEAQARVQVDLETAAPSLGGNSKGGSVVVNSPVNDPAYFNTQLQILNSPGLLRRVVKTLDLENNQGFLRPQAAQKTTLWGGLKRMAGVMPKSENATAAAEETSPKLAVAPPSSNQDLVEAKRLAPYVEALEKNLKIEPVKENRLMNKETRLIDITFRHSDPLIAAKVVNAVSDVFELSNFEKKAETNSTAGSFLQARIAELKDTIRNGEERLINYAKNNQILSLDASQNTVLERLAGLNRQLLEAENERKMAEAAYRAALAPGAASALAEGAAKEPAEAEAKLADLRQRRAQLLVENTEEWPEVKEVEQQIKVLENYLQDIRGRAVGTVLTNLETRYRQAQAREQALQKTFDQQRGETLVQNEAAIQYRIIQQEIETNRSLLDGLLQRSKENDVVLVGMPNNVRVVDYALAPDLPIGPKRLQSVLVSLLLGLGASVGLALFLEYLDDTVSSPAEVEKLLHLPALAVIPAIKGTERNRLLPAIGGTQMRENLASSDLQINPKANGNLAEAYKHLRTSMLFTADGNAPKTLLVTSSLPSEGKTTTAINTAASLALTGSNVLVVDADLRSPRLHTIFGRDNEHGLSSFLSREISEHETLALIERDSGSNLYLLPSGPVPENPAELLGSERMSELLSLASARYDYVVIDSPPITAFTDGVLLSSMVDGVLLVVHSGKSSQEVIKRSQKMLQDIGSRIYGVVLNRAKADSHGYVRYYHPYGSRN